MASCIWWNRILVANYMSRCFSPTSCYETINCYIFSTTRPLPHSNPAIWSLGFCPEHRWAFGPAVCKAGHLASRAGTLSLNVNPQQEVCWPCGQNQLYCPETLAIVLPGFIFIKMLTPSFSFICLLPHWRISSRRTELLPTLFNTISQHLEPSLTPNRSSNISRTNALGKQWWALGHNSSSFS